MAISTWVCASCFATKRLAGYNNEHSTDATLQRLNPCQPATTRSARLDERAARICKPDRVAVAHKQNSWFVCLAIGDVKMHHWRRRACESRSSGHPSCVRAHDPTALQIPFFAAPAEAWVLVRQWTRSSIFSYQSSPARSAGNEDD